MAVLITEAVCQDVDQNRSSFPLPAEHHPRQRETAIRWTTIPATRPRLDALTIHSQEIPRRDFSQVSISRDLLRPFESSLGEISFGQSLQTPRDAPEQMFSVPGSRGLVKQLAELRAQIGQRGPAQVLNFHQDGSVHSCFPLGV